eukprot:CAMPEP_0204292974 /NCGR_PEP_ID=MMETSP0468-20130131/65258_1 /ASSEMBLY_ACC=CAM_ASM_000383 /TAXON_ID=2969 /ORGANISM="Oxyrrhis marina" /LENGTH=101 /DNA_ID=CAMNT_0051271397 /DNA_START=326 /DNA_END=631 /DNA_ORIENTATION=+
MDHKTVHNPQQQLPRETQGLCPTDALYKDHTQVMPREKLQQQGSTHDWDTSPRPIHKQHVWRLLENHPGGGTKSVDGAADRGQVALADLSAAGELQEPQGG